MNENYLKQKQSLNLKQKIIITENRIRQFYNKMDGNVYIAFSGGKDSTVLLNIARNIYPDIKGVFVDTGLEYPEIRNFVKTIDNIDWIKPKMNFKKVIEKYGYPIISKEISQKLRQLQTLDEDSISYNLRKYGVDSKGDESKIGIIPYKYLYLENAPFKISEKCCDILKKNPFKEYEKINKTHAIIGTMASDSNMRKRIYLKNGCNDFKNNISKPLSIWLQNDIWDYIKQFDINYCSIYDRGLDRTGCIFCMFGINKEKNNRFEILKELHPDLYDYCMYKLDIKFVLDWIENNKPNNFDIDKVKVI